MFSLRNLLSGLPVAFVAFVLERTAFVYWGPPLIIVQQWPKTYYGAYCSHAIFFLVLGPYVWYASMRRDTLLNAACAASLFWLTIGSVLWGYFAVNIHPAHVLGIGSLSDHPLMWTIVTVGEAGIILFILRVVEMEEFWLYKLSLLVGGALLLAVMLTVKMNYKAAPQLIVELWFAALAVGLVVLIQMSRKTPDELHGGG